METIQIDDAVLIAGQISAAIIAISGAVAILHRVFFKKLCNQLEAINKELHPNGGTSLRDAVNRIEKTQTELKSDIENVRDKVDDHILWHLDN